jgi:hypothetical protein
VAATDGRKEVPMSAIAHAPTHAWAGAHRALLLVATLAVLAVAAAVTIAVVLFTGDDAASAPLAPNVPGSEVACQNAPIHTPC